MTKILPMLTVTAPLLAALAALGQEDQEKSSSIWMRQKLVASQNILAGLTKADFDAIGKNATSMLAVSHLEKWVRADVPGYRELIQDFDHANRTLALAARERNLDGATVAYLQLTVSCVNCHKLVRDRPVTR